MKLLEKTGIIDNPPDNLEQTENAEKVDFTKVLQPGTPSQGEQNVFERIEGEIERQLTDKAEKCNLTVLNVKNIIRQVLTNDHVKALLDKGTAEQAKQELSAFGPKLTRAKTKELLAARDIPIPQVKIPWIPVPPPSEALVLIGEDLKEDDSGDEYIPKKEIAKRDSVARSSDAATLPPPTPPTPMCTEDHATQTSNCTGDGVLKVPLATPAQGASVEVTNMALRTRSKINLSSTSLEDIEKAFIPPDITTDMYDMECDDDEWRNFLKGFTEPLDEVTKHTEDEELDPEYNIMADDQINQFDNEDFRMDKAVKITKKEVKELYEELFDYLNSLSEEYDGTNGTNENNQLSEIIEKSYHAMENPDFIPDAQQQQDTLQNLGTNQNATVLIDIKIELPQLQIIEQQMRQHVQMLTQNFFLTYEHPEYHSYSKTLKEYLLNLKFLANGKNYSMFSPVNLLPALDLIEKWEVLCASNSETVRQCREHVQQQLLKSIQYRMGRNWEFIATFPKLILETISNSEVFVYPGLLPKIPFKSQEFSSYRSSFTEAEDHLLAFSLDQFRNFLGNNTSTREVVSHVKELIMPHRDVTKIMRHIRNRKHPQSPSNPIQQYLLHNKLRPVVHYFYPLNEIVPPCKRCPEELPEQWRNFIHPAGLTPVKAPLSVNKSLHTKQQCLTPQVILINNSLGGSTVFNSSGLSTNPSKLVVSNTSMYGSPIEGNQTVWEYLSGLQQHSIQSTPPLQFWLNDVAASSSFAAVSNSSSPSKQSSTSNLTTVERVVSIFLRSIAVQKLVGFLVKADQGKVNQSGRLTTPNRSSRMADLGATLDASGKPQQENEEKNRAISNETASLIIASSIEEQRKPETTTTSTAEEPKRLKVARNIEFSTIMSSSFQKSNTSSEVEFCRNASDMPICQTSQSDENDGPVASGDNSQAIDSEKDNPEDINELLVASTTLKPDSKSNAKRKVSTAERKKNKLRKEFLTNLAIATPDNPDNERHKNEMFAVAYYDKLRETLEFEDYHKIMRILNDFGAGDVIDLYNDVQAILVPKYHELAEDFLFFLRQKEAATVGKLIPWLQMQTRVKFLRKLEVCFKDQPTQLKRVYNTLMELSKNESINMEKIKATLIPMLKGSKILMDLLLQGFKDEPPPPSLLEGPYETIDINKELARPDNEEMYETFVVPNTEDKYGGQNCICHCHRIEDNEYKSRFKHCNSCGLKFVNGKLYLSVGRSFQPATIAFKTNRHINHNARLMSKSATAGFSHKKKRPDNSPNKISGFTAKEALEEDTEDEELGKRKKSISRTPRKRVKLSSPKKSPGRCSDSAENTKHRKRTYSSRKSKKDEGKRRDMETENRHEQMEEREGQSVELKAEKYPVVADVDESEHEASEEQREKSTEYCMDSSGESLEKSLTPEQHTMESETELDVEESSQDNYESDESSSSTESTKGSQSDSNTNDEPAWGREEDTIILETIQKEDDKEYALQIISDKLPNRTVAQIRSRLSRLVNLLIETLKSK
ncbi:hypothetical protein HUJ04_004470 [Dendroctonus ponderosae]|uniref:Myb-like domain-containing protein n=2 Tax=Dendroctonus ponderosae TaxID=77166 RepID=A0AAR5PBD0_DENPD|nr:hypothetical protein HUJ04_004470 [Dendroctonus ponderosae]